MEEIKKAVLVGLDLNDKNDFEHSMEEMRSLIEACDMELLCQVIQRLAHPEAGTYLGSGKIEEVKTFVKNMEADYCIFEDNLSPAQQKNLQNALGVPVWDRTNLILEIFSRRAKTREARLQVESAYLQYMLPRLAGMWQHLERQGGGSGSTSNKGVGEKQIELDRRHIRQRLSELSRELDTIKKTRQTQRMGRQKGNLPMVALVGYTNAGKSTLMNCLLKKNSVSEEKQVFEKDMLFATLDTSIRRIEQEDKRDFLLSDTVGFIEKLPHGLVKAFRSTLEEAANADLLLIVLDASDPYYPEHKNVALSTLKELEAENIRKLYVMNKSDLTDYIPGNVDGGKDTVYISASTGEGVEELLQVISDILYESNRQMTVLIPYDKGSILNLLHEKAAISSEEYTAEGVLITANVPKAVAGVIEDFICEWGSE